MSNFVFDNYNVNKSGTNWLQYAAFVVTAFANYFGWAFFIYANSQSIWLQNVQVPELQ